MTSNYREYRLRSCAHSLGHNVMVMPDKHFSFNDLIPPVKLYRTTAALLEEPSRPTFEDPSTLIAKTQVTVASMEELGRPKEYAWWLKDGENRNWVGRPEGGQRSKYVLFVNQGNEFKMIVVDKWYRFQPKLHYQILDIDEAEKKMGEKAVFGSDRWIMKARKDSASKMQQLRHDIWTEGEETRHEVEEQIDFEQVFDDDESGDTDESSTPQNRGSLTRSGRELKRTLKNVDKHNVYDSDEERDPYASGDSSSDKELGSQDTEPSKRALQESNGGVSKRLKSRPSSLDPDLLNEDDIISHLRVRPMRTKDLILLIKPKLRASPENKDRFRVLVKKLAIVKTDSNDDKLLELKPEFRAASPA